LVGHLAFVVGKLLPKNKVLVKKTIFGLCNFHNQW